jgi:hypothetical protein
VRCSAGSLGGADDVGGDDVPGVDGVDGLEGADEPDESDDPDAPHAARSVVDRRAATARAVAR